jgi:hypothetical protein
MTIRSCVTPQKQFSYGIHKPAYIASNLRKSIAIIALGHLETGEPYSNRSNYPKTDVHVKGADWIFEIPNPLSFQGTTFIDKTWADNSANNSSSICLPARKELSFSKLLEKEHISHTLFEKLPPPLLLTLATTSTDPDDLVHLAELCCIIEKDKNNIPTGLHYKKNANGQTRALISNHALFEAVANNPALPDNYKLVMVLRPGAQGGSEIVGEYKEKGKTHVFEYLRRNSYIPGGHYAANMADDAIRYSIAHLSKADMTGLRHLYYQRSFVRLAKHLGLEIHNIPDNNSVEWLEHLRKQILQNLFDETNIEITATLWGWNFGFDYAPTDYRLHASHQQIHQQYSMLPQTVDTYGTNLQNATGSMKSFGCGDMVAEVMQNYHKTNNSSFFPDYIDCIRNNERMDERTNLESSLILWEDEHAMLFVPKAQTSQWELQLMALTNENGDIIGNILEADTASRTSLNNGIFFAQKALAALGARMVTSIEYPKRIGKAGEAGQHLLYSFLPRLPESPGAFSEAQRRYINGHYPEDFAAVCRQQLEKGKFYS